MSDFTYNLKSNCPICNGSQADRGRSCRSSQDLVFCRSNDPAPNGWAYVKTDPWGFGVYAPGKGDKDNSEAREQRQRERTLRHQAELKRLAGTSTRRERDRSIRKLAKIMGLSRAHEKELKHRGLTSIQIKRGLFFTIPDCPPWERPELPTIPLSLPGIKLIRSKHYLLGDSGIACPVWQGGRAIGWQLLADDRENGKYKWAYGEFSSHLRNGELPLFYYQTTESKALWLMEGTLKPFIACNRLEINAIAAPNANYSGCPQQFELLTKGVNTFYLAFDGGDTANPTVMARWANQVDYVRSVYPNATIKVAWWGQATKADPDIDEIESIDGIEFLPFEQFYTQKSESTNSKLSPQEWAEQKRESDHKRWLNSKKYTPHVVSESEFCDFDVPAANTLTIIKAGLGAGKSTRLAWVIQELRSRGIPLSFISLGYRNSLLHQSNRKTGFYHIQDGAESKLMLRSGDGYGVSLCVDSLLKFKPDDFNGVTVILDEFTSITRHLLKSKTISSSNRKRIIDNFAECLNRAERVIALDALGSDFMGEYLHSLCPLKTLVRWENVYQRPRPQIYLYEGALSAMGEIRKADKSPLYAKMVTVVASGKRIIVACDSQNRAEALDRLLSKTFPEDRGLRIDSKTVAEKGEYEEFLNNANEYLSKNNISWLIYTSSAESGIDINLPGYFSEFYGLFDGVLSVDAILQMIGRERDVNVPRHVFVATKLLPGNRVGEYPETAKQCLEKKVREIMHGIDLSVAFSGEKATGLPEMLMLSMSEIIKTPSDKMAWALESLRSFEGHNLRQCVREVLELNGFPVTIVADIENDGLRKAVKEQSEEVRLEEAVSIYNAEKVDELPERSYSSTWSDRAVEISYYLRKRLPGIDSTPLWTAEGIKFLRSDEPEFIRQQERFLKLKHEQLTSRLSREKIANLVKYNPGVLVNVRDDSLMIDTLRECGLLSLIESGKEFHNESPEIRSFVRKATRNKKAIGKSKGNDSPMRFVNRLSALFGIKFTLSRRVEGTRYYTLDSKSMNDGARLIVLERLESKWADIISGEIEEIDYTEILVPNLEWVPESIKEDEYAVALSYCQEKSDVKAVLEDFKEGVRGLGKTIQNAAKLFRLNQFQFPEEYAKNWLSAIAGYIQPMLSRKLFAM